MLAVGQIEVKPEARDEKRRGVLAAVPGTRRACRVLERYAKVYIVLLGVTLGGDGNSRERRAFEVEPI
jgi:hypothetical protein